MADEVRIDDYVNKFENQVNNIITVGGLLGVLGGVVFDRSNVIVGGGILMGAGIASEAITYMKAYMSAKLEYMNRNPDSRSSPTGR